MNAIDLAGRLALVTGGCGDIGRAVSARFAASGARVVTWDLAESADERVDLTDEAQVEAAMARLLGRDRRLDILVNCAGITGPNQPVESYSLAEWRRVLDINLTSTFLCCRAAVPAMRRQNAGRIVNLASIAGKEGNATQSAYSAAKAAVIALTKSLGKELADTEVRVNCVAPALIATQMNLQMTEEALRTVLAKIPLGRPGTAEEVAALVAWLASDDCSFSTGACFDLSGGRATY
jgi:NAD(P)-dependent dehydrogenase (short-subunit alcohol dehydrogenase family)